MTWHVAFAHLDQAIGGYFPIASFPQWPVMPDESTLADFEYYSTEMNWFVMSGADDDIFDGEDG